MPDDYNLKNDDGPWMRYIPLPDERPARLKRRRRNNDPFWVRLMEWNPFPWIMMAAVLTWVGLGLGARLEPSLRFVLAAAGLVFVVLGQIYLYLLIFRDSTWHGIFSAISDLYCSIYLHANIELSWKPMCISGCGILMMITGMFGFVR